MGTVLGIPRDARGFTIVELIVVMALIGIMASIVAPVFRLPPERQVENMAHLMVAHLELARAEALGSRRVVGVAFDTIGGGYVGYADHNGDGALTGVADEVSAFPAFGSLELADLVTYGRGAASAFPGDPGSASVTLPGLPHVIFNDRGIPEPLGTMGTIYLVHARESDAVSAVTVSSAGTFRAWRWWADEGVWK